MRIGIQGFGLQNQPKGDVAAFFGGLHRSGYRYYEPCISFRTPDPNAAWSIWPAEGAAELAKAVCAEGFEIYSAHAQTENAAEDADRMVAVAKEVGIRQYVLPVPADHSPAALAAAAEIYKACAKKLAAVGVELLVHGAAVDPVEGTTATEYFLDCCDGLVGMQPDVGWIHFGGVDEMAFLRRNESRIRSMHYKDFSQGKEVPVGTGEVDTFGVFQFAQLHDLIHMVDMDSCNSPEAVDAAGKLFEYRFGYDRSWTESVLCTMDVDTGEITELHHFDEVIEAPNWLMDGDTLFYNSLGKLWKYHISTDTIEQLDTGDKVRCSNDHVPSPDGKQYAISEMTVEEGAPFGSWVYVSDLEHGGELKKITPKSASWVHGWSKDNELVYCAVRDEGSRTIVNIMTMPAEGGPETVLTDGIGYNDGPEYSPDDKHIWFNSTRSGMMQVWRMDRDGGNLTHVIESEDNDWFPHVSPDGKRVVYLTFPKGSLDPNQHLSNYCVSLSIMDYDGSNNRKLLSFFGGQGSINVNSWAPDSKRIALVIYPPKGM